MNFFLIGIKSMTGQKRANLTIILKKSILVLFALTNHKKFCALRSQIGVSPVGAHVFPNVFTAAPGPTITNGRGWPI